MEDIIMGEIREIEEIRETEEEIRDRKRKEFNASDSSKIKPETDITLEEAKNFWNDFFIKYI